MTQAETTSAGADSLGLDLPRLAAYLAPRLDGFERPEAVVVQQFSAGQSNPTFRLTTPVGDYVLRKKPAGKLLPSAHAIEREFAVMSGLADYVPVPKMLLLCENPAIIGQPFYVMEHVSGRIFTDARLQGASRDERAALTFELVSVLARLHRVDPQAAGLGGFGRAGGYIERQLARLTEQWSASKVEDNPDMDLIVAWLRANRPAGDESCVVHGDYRSYNVIYSTEQPRIVAVLDWELATIGHPLADLAFGCLPYHLPADDLRGFRGEDPAVLGIPSESDLVAHYCRETGRTAIPDWSFYLVFALFRSAAIRAGVYKRAFDGTAASPQAREMGGRYRAAAAAAARLVGEVAA